MKVSEEELKRLFQQERERGAIHSRGARGGLGGAAPSAPQLNDERAAGGREACPSAEFLARAAEGTLRGQERDELADHLVACPDCAQEFRFLAPLRQWAEEVASKTPTNVVEMSRPVATPSTIRMSASPFGRAYLPHTLAAGLAAVSLGLGVFSLSLRQEHRRLEERLRERDLMAAEERGRLEAVTRQAKAYEFQVAELRRDLDALSQPQPNVPIVDLLPPGAERGTGAAAAATVDLQEGVRMVTLILNLGSEPAYPAYSAEILGQDGGTIWQGDGLKRNPENTFTLVLPTRLVPAGQYRLRLYGLRGDSRVRLEDYGLKVVSRSRP